MPLYGVLRHGQTPVSFVAVGLGCVKWRKAVRYQQSAFKENIFFCLLPTANFSLFRMIVNPPVTRDRLIDIKKPASQTDAGWYHEDRRSGLATTADHAEHSQAQEQQQDGAQRLTGDVGQQ